MCEMSYDVTTLNNRVVLRVSICIASLYHKDIRHCGGREIQATSLELLFDYYFTAPNYYLCCTIVKSVMFFKGPFKYYV